jgi:hypothetical protein
MLNLKKERVLMILATLRNNELVKIDPTITYGTVLQANYAKFVNFTEQYSLQSATEYLRTFEGFENVTQEEVNFALYGTNYDSCYGLIPSTLASLEGNNPFRSLNTPKQYKTDILGVYKTEEGDLIVKGVLRSPYIPKYVSKTHMTTKIKDFIREHLKCDRFISTPVSSYTIED